MQKIKHFSVNDILTKRNSKSLSRRRKIIQNSPNNTINKTIQSFFTQDDDQHNSPVQYNADEVIYSIVQIASTKGCESVSTELKTKLLEVIAKKTNLSLNIQNILPNVKICKSKHIEIIQRKHMQRRDMTFSCGSQYRKPPVEDCDSNTSYFVLKGNISIYKQDKTQKANKVKTKLSVFEDQDYFSEESLFLNLQEIQKQFPKFKKAQTISDVTGIGFLFSMKKKQESSRNVQSSTNSMSSQNEMIKSSARKPQKVPQFLVAQDAIYIEIPPPKYETEYINSKGIQLDKIQELVQSCPIFLPLGRRVKNFLQFFEFKEYKRNQQIYCKNSPIKSFYIVVSGEIVFQHLPKPQSIQIKGSPKAPRKLSLTMENRIKTECISAGNYFGQEQVIYKLPVRILTARCKSLKCQLLELGADKLEKMLQYSDFFQSVKSAALVRHTQRQNNLQKSTSIKNKYISTQPTIDEFDTIQSSQSKLFSERNTVKMFQPRRKSNSSGAENIKVMHGNTIRQYSKQQKAKMNEQVNFSMLSANPDMYENTLKKFRKFNIKTPVKYKAQVNWDLKRVWKVLNLENILREETEIGNPEGRKFYDSHRRYVNQVTESKSLRPKTSSSTFRTKLQYIAYLQQFKQHDFIVK